MFPDDIRSVALRIQPHLFILGAGASCAATPAGELNGRALPVTASLPAAAELQSVLDAEQFRAATNDFEAFFSSLREGADAALRQTIEDRIYAYFDAIEIASSVTLYDRLVLSLRRKDAIATF